MSDLFPDSETAKLSPKLAWLKRNHLETWSERDDRWLCGTRGRTVMAIGATEDEAILAYCELRGIKHWTLDDAP